jgi:hypothetical protein
VERHPDLVTPDVPWFLTKEYGEKEFALLRSVEGYLRLLKSGAEDLISAICLFESCQRQAKEGELFLAWMSVAARDGALSINNMAMGLHYTRKLVGAIEPIRAEIDFGKLAEAEKFFREKFPNAERIRHVVAHQEFYSNPDVNTELDEPFNNGVISAVATNTISRVIIDDTYLSSWQGEPVQYSLNRETALDAVTTCELFFDGFAKIDRHRW